VQRACILSDSDEILIQDLFLEARKTKKEIKNLEKDLIIEVLQSVNFNIKEASDILGMQIHILEEKIQKYNIKG
ncbi:sigma-54-dependent Fis family transcriptional regulator, partial [Campylobacter sp. TTU-622]